MSVQSATEHEGIMVGHSVIVAMSCMQLQGRTMDFPMSVHLAPGHGERAVGAFLIIVASEPIQLSRRTMHYPSRCSWLTDMGKTLAEPFVS